MRLTAILIAVLLLSACPHSRSAADEAAATAPQPGGTPSTRGRVKKLAVVFSATQSDNWTNEIANALGAQLGFDPWSVPGQSGHLDTYGPYQGKLNEQAVEVSIALAGLNSVADLLSQQALGEEARQWVEACAPDIAWLDGDQANFVVGRPLNKSIPIIFTGTVAEQDVYYEFGRNVTGVYKRYSLPGVMGEIWTLSQDAKRIALLSDNSSLSRSQLIKFKEQLDIVLPREYPALECDPVHDWTALKRQLVEQAKQQDALVVCGVGGDLGSEAFSQKPCPPDLLAGIEVPVIVLGPSPLDHCGALVLSLVPAQHVKYALDSVTMIFRGRAGHAILSVTPPEMDVFRSEQAP
jgi:hypothetical protein